MKKELKAISAKNDLDFYYNAENIPNQDLVFGTLEYFETGKRKGFFEPLEFINLLWEQYNFVNTNFQKPHTTITALKALPLTVEQKHVLFGFILKWFGGYPIENMNKQYDTTLRLIEKEFLSYKKQTPEKQFCQKDWVQYSRRKQIEGFMNDSINGKGQNTEYDFVKVKEYLKTLPNVKEQIKFLTEIQTEYKQNQTGWEMNIGTAFDEQCELEIKKLDKIFNLEQSTPTETKTEKKNSPLPTKTFPEYLLHPKREQLANALKSEFTTEKGKGIYLMIKVLTDATPPLLSIENRQRNAIYEALKSFFDRDIASYQGIFDTKYLHVTHSADLQSIEAKINFILKSIENDK